MSPDLERKNCPEGGEGRRGGGGVAGGLVRIVLMAFGVGSEGGEW